MNRIAEYRKSAMLNQKELGAKLGVAQTTISGWETGAREPDRASLRKLMEFFDVPADVLMGYDSPTRHIGEQLESMKSTIDEIGDGTVPATLSTLIDMLEILKTAMSDILTLPSFVNNAGHEAIADVKAKYELINGLTNALLQFADDPPEELLKAATMILPKIRDTLDMSDFDKTIRTLKDGEG
jgi:transcriptional regulator with XRE-family HTH domain